MAAMAPDPAGWAVRRWSKSQGPLYEVLVAFVTMLPHVGAVIVDWTNYEACFVRNVHGFKG